MKEIKAPGVYNNKEFTIFLAGTIDMNNSIDWQKEVADKLSDCEITILNPRRDDWDSSWEQDPTSGTKFNEQVNWELTALEDCNIIIMHISDESKSPIALLELGLYATSQKMVVYCTDKFYRYGNVKIVCDKYNIPLFDDIDELIDSLID